MSLPKRSLIGNVDYLERTEARKLERDVGGTYKDLEAWKVSMELVAEIYRGTASFPREEMFGLTSQMRRLSVSTASNIAEGKGRFSDRELGQFLSVARLFSLRSGNSSRDREEAGISVRGRGIATSEPMRGSWALAKRSPQGSQKTVSLD
jgi:hypothetical protein